MDALFNLDDLKNTQEATSGDTEINNVNPDLDNLTISDSGQNEVLFNLVKYLKENDAILLDEEETGEDLSKLKLNSVEDLKELINKSNNKFKYKDLTESQKRYQEALTHGVPIKEYEEIEKQLYNIEQLKEEDLDDDQTQFQILALDFIDKNHTKEEAIELAEALVKNKEKSAVKEKVKAAKKRIYDSRYNKYQELVNNTKTTHEVSIKQIDEALKSKKDLLSMDIDDNTKKKLFELITTKVANDDSGMPLNQFRKWQKENPLESEIILNYLFLISNQGKDLSKLKLQSDSKAAQELTRKLQQLSFAEDGSINIPENYLLNNSNNKISKKPDPLININI